LLLKIGDAFKAEDPIVKGNGTTGIVDVQGGFEEAAERRDTGHMLY
jgi:hypothetical protein